ncbi:MAG: HAMP domain-containing histidine kinase [Gammaproteobacteria bacterium]|nr:HAMP domain-containing histidine kinase [Gammaproteobacteria bacterium]
MFITTELGETFNILRVKDTAGGVAQETVANLFEGFTTTKEQGTGIGLAFCQLGMRSFGGDITCHRVEGDCIEFIMSFPKNNSFDLK